MENIQFLTLEELEAGLDGILRSPKNAGTLELIVRRPTIEEREVLAEGRLDSRTGLVGDTWSTRGSARSGDGSPYYDTQLTLMNARVISLLSPAKERWPLAGDQLFVDLDLCNTNLPLGTQLSIGSAVIEITAQPHTGCQKFAARFGKPALVFVNGPQHKELRLRGVYARIIQAGMVKTGDLIRKVQ